MNEIKIYACVSGNIKQVIELNLPIAKQDFLEWCSLAQRN